MRRGIIAAIRVLVNAFTFDDGANFTFDDGVAFTFAE
jgi:hypothetical protein